MTDPPATPIHLEKVRSLLHGLFEAPPECWPQQLERLCAEHPRHAAEIQRRYRLLQSTGLDLAPPEPGRAAAPAIPAQLGEFRLLRRLGSGGMGVVYLAEQPSLKRTVALKLVQPELLWFPRAKERFHREIEAVARLSHPGIVAIHAVGEEQGVAFFAMEHVAGQSLDRVIKELAGRAPERLTGRDLAGCLAGSSAELYAGSWPDACLRIVHSIADALAHAHARGVIHRDVKPSNVMLTADGRVVLLDFGLALAQGTSAVTRTGAQIGSLPYMAPEQVRGEHDRVDARSDVYSLGVTLYELLTLRSPFEAPSAETTRRNILQGTAPPPRVLNRQVSADLAVVCGTALDLDPRRRYQGMAEFARDLDNLLVRRAIAARPPTLWRRTQLRAQRHPAATVGVLAALLLTVGTPTAITFAIAAQRDRARAAEALADRRAHEASIAAASTALQAGDGAEARRRLDACPEALRGFEWRHLDLALDGSLRRFVGHADKVTAVAITDDGEQMVSGDERGTLLCWEPLRGTGPRRIPLDGADEITALGFTPDAGRLVVLQRREGGETACVVDLATAAVVARRGSTAPGEQLCLVADHSAVLAARSDFTVEELDAATLASRRSVQLEAVGSAPAGHLVSDGTWLFMSWSGDVQAWHLADGRAEVQHGAFGAGVASAAAAARRGVAAFATADGRLFAADTAPLRVRALDHAGRRLEGLALDDSGTWLAGIDGDNGLRTWHVRKGRLLATAYGAPGGGCAVALASRRLLVVVGGAAGRLELFGLFGGRDRQALIGQSGKVIALATSPDGTLLSASQEPVLRAWSPDSGRPERASYAARHWINALAIGADGQHAFVTYGSAIVRVRLPDLGTIDEMGIGTRWIHALLTLRDGRLLALTHDRGLLLVDYEHRSVVQEHAVPDGPARVAALAPDRRQVFTGGKGRIARWQVTGGIELIESLPAVGEIRALACSSDGTRLYTSEGSMLRARAFGGAVAWERSCPEPALALWPLPDGSRLVSGHRDGTFNIWDASDGSRTLILHVGTSPILAIVGEPGGRWLAASENARITMFRTGTDRDGFAQRLAQADTLAATHLDEELRLLLPVQADVLAAIERRTDLDAGLRTIMAQVERLRPAITWEAQAGMLAVSALAGQDPATYERALHLAEARLADAPDDELCGTIAAFATLRLDRPEDALRHCDRTLQSHERRELSAVNPIRAARVMALVALGRRDEARTELATLHQELALVANPDVDDLRLLHEAERAVASVK